MKVYGEFEKKGYFDDAERKEYNDAVIDVINFIDSLNIDEVPLHQGTCDVTEIYDFQSLASGYGLTQKEYDKLIDNAQKWLDHKINTKVYKMESIKKKAQHDKLFEVRLSVYANDSVYDEMLVEKVWSKLDEVFTSVGMDLNDIDVLEIKDSLE